MTERHPSAWEELRAGWQARRDRARDEVANSRNHRHVSELRRALSMKREMRAAASRAPDGGAR